MKVILVMVIGDSRPRYTVSSVIFVAQVICVAIGWVLAHSTGGQACVALGRHCSLHAPRC